MKYSRILLIIGLYSVYALSQNQKFTISEAVNGLRSNLAVKNISQFSFSEDSQSYRQAVKGGYLITQINSGKTDTLISLYQINQGLPKEKKFKSLPTLKFTSENKAYFFQNNQYYWLMKEGNKWKMIEGPVLPQNAQNKTLLDDGETVIYTLEHNLYLHQKGKTIPISEEQNPNIISGQAVHRNEFGINEGIFISPAQDKVAFYKMDQSMVTDYPVIHWNETPAKNENIKYPMAGAKSHEVSLGILDIKKNKKYFLNIEGDKEQYLTSVSWSPDSEYIFVGVLNRQQNHLKLNQYNASNGNFVKTLFEEKSDTYVEPQHPLLFLPNSNKDFIWQSQRSGYNHLYHYHLDKGLVSQITNGDWLVSSVLGFNEKKKEIYFTATKETPLEKHLYKVNWLRPKIIRLDSQPGVHSGILSKDGNYLYDSYSNENTPRVVNIIHTQNLKTQNVLTSEDPLKNYQRADVKNITLSADDGTPLYGKLILPPNLEKNKKYPVIVYLYNGPHLQLITNSYPASGNLWYEFMTQKDYIIFTMDGRGSSNRGLKFEQAIFRNLGEVEMNDQLKGVEYLKSLPFVDSQKMGIHGWSYGGFMTTSFMLKKPDVFQVGVAGGPVLDWSMYEIMYTERYMDTPNENPEGYKNSLLLDKVQNLKGKLLMIHGAQDDVVVWQHSMKFLKSAVDNGVQIDYFVYPGHAHNVVGKDRQHLMQKVTDYFDQYLKN